MVPSLGRSGRNAHILVFSVLLLVTLGVVMLFSTTAFSAGVRADDLYFDAKRQVFWLSVGIVFCGILTFFDYRKIQNWIWPIYAIAAALLLFCFVPHLGQEINGEKRWISAAAVGLHFRIQPSEFAKLTLMATLAAWLARHASQIDETWHGITVPSLIAALILGLIAAEVDIGTTAVLSGAAFAVMFVAGSNRKFLLVGVGCATAGLATLVAVVPGRMTRVMAILHPEAYERGAGHQQAMAKLALGSGGIQGIGLGEGRLKMLYMPFAHTDFIFPMIGEELGLAGTLAVLLCFAAFTVAGLSIALNAPEPFGQLLGTGIVLCIAIQALLNIAVTTAVFPNTGLPLPFVSYGGSNLVCSLIGVGILLNIYRQSQAQPPRGDFMERTRAITARI